MKQAWTIVNLRDGFIRAGGTQAEEWFNDDYKNVPVVVSKSLLTADMVVGDALLASVVQSILRPSSTQPNELFRYFASTSSISVACGSSFYRAS